MPAYSQTYILLYLRSNSPVYELYDICHINDEGKIIKNYPLALSAQYNLIMPTDDQVIVPHIERNEILVIHLKNKKEINIRFVFVASELKTIKTFYFSETKTFCIV